MLTASLRVSALSARLLPGSPGLGIPVVWCLSRCRSQSNFIRLCSRLVSGSSSIGCRSRRTDRAPANPSRKRIVFLGTPEVAASSLRRLLQSAADPESSFEITAVVTQPGRPQGRGKRPQPSPVEAVAASAGLAQDRIFCPQSARETAFLESLEALQPDLCITAAYGNILPQAFLNIPMFGTLNIHPSLLPAYRGAAPVQRALLDGKIFVGVSVAFTVRAMDAGPVLVQEERKIDDFIQAPELLQALFEQGTDLLLKSLPQVWAGDAEEHARPQDEDAATHAAKLTKQDSLLDFSQPARTLHNKVRGQAGWPGTAHPFVIRRQDGSESQVHLKVLATRLARQQQRAAGLCPEQVQGEGQKLFVWCGDGSALELLQVQPAGKKPMSAQAFANGLASNILLWQRPSRN